MDLAPVEGDTGGKLGMALRDLIGFSGSSETGWNIKTQHGALEGLIRPRGSDGSRKSSP
jgi:hypothetical protein